MRLTCFVDITNWKKFHTDFVNNAQTIARRPSASDNPAMNSLHLVLRLPIRLEQALAAAARTAPSLMALLGRGEPLSADPGLAAIGCQAFGIARQQDWPLAPISALADGLAPGEAYWLRLDPAHLEVGMGGLMLRTADTLGLADAEAAALVASLNRNWAGEGLELAAPTATRWYLRLPAPPEVGTTPLDQVAGEYLSPHLPRGRDARRLMAMVNEAQMLLHDHAVNQARDNAGLPPVNGLWLWGGGILPVMRPRLDLAASDAPEIRALATAAGVEARPSPSHLEELRAAGRFRNALATLAPSPEDHDLAAYLAELERAWFKPLLRGLALGRMRAARVDLLAGPGRASLLTPARAWRFWRRAG
jgi:hypothetical protein